MSESENKYFCNDHLKGNVKNLGQVCPRCLIAIYNKQQKLLEFVNTVRLDNLKLCCWQCEAENVLKEIGEVDNDQIKG